jgi:RHS repeat-associated protein
MTDQTKGKVSAANKAIALVLMAAGLAATIYWVANKRDHQGTTATENPSSPPRPVAKASPGQESKPPVVDSAQFRPIPNRSGSIQAPAYVKASPQEEKEWTAKARPTEHTSLLLLDLSRIPSEQDLRMAGQLGEELIPTRAADPTKISDTAARSALEKDNLSFGNAIQEWNLHHYEKACALFTAHLSAYPKSPWAAEAELHLGCSAQYLGKFDEAENYFEASANCSPTGHPMNAKATLRLGALAMESGNLDAATQRFASLHASSDTPSHSTYASYWITRLSLMKEKTTSMRDCAQKSLAEICAVMGKPAAAAKLRVMENTRPKGFNLQEIEDLAKEQGLTAGTVITTDAHIADLPVPFIAHYSRGEQLHFVAVLAQPTNGRIRLFDTRAGGVIEADYGDFKGRWSGYATLFHKVPEISGIQLASAESKRTVVGGCCGLPKAPDDLACGKSGGGGCSSCSRGMPSWSVNPVNMNLNIQDSPMWWDAPYGPGINMTLNYNSLDSLVSIRPFGDKWTFAYSAYAMQDPSGAVLIMYGNAFIERYSHNVDGTFSPESRNAGSTLTKTGDYTFVVEGNDGTKYTFSVPISMSGASAASLLTSIEDKYGATVTIQHNPQGALISITHSAGGTWGVTYNAAGKVSCITDPFGRVATFVYDENLHLIGQTDQGGSIYGYGYTTATRVKERDPLYPDFGHSAEWVERSNELFINVLNLPTGTYQFDTEPADGINNMNQGYANYSYPPNGGLMWENYRITVTDPLTQKEEYYFDGYQRAGWHRDKRYFQQGHYPADDEPLTRYNYTTAGGRGKISQTQHQGGGSSSSSNFDNAGRPASATGTDGRITQYTYNNLGNVLTRQEGADSDPNKIIYTTTYAPNLKDAITETRTVAGTTVTLSSKTYDTKGDVASQTDGLGLTTSYVRNVRGQVTEVTDPTNAVTRMTYNVDGRLDHAEYKAPGQTAYSVAAVYAYDLIGRAAAETNADGYLVEYEYDLLNRRIKTTYPDTTYEQWNYSCCTLTSARARDGSITQYTYDALKRPLSVVGAGGQMTSYQYDKANNTTGINFGRGEGVAWTYDSGNRVTAKTYPDGSSLTYIYDKPDGKLLWSKDAKSRITGYHYDSYGRITSVTSPELPTQSYTYDSLGNRLTWHDGGNLTSYTYDTQNRLLSLDGPLDHDTFTFQYDNLGRSASFTYDGASESYTYDTLGRLASVTNPLGTFTQTYEGNTGILAQLQYPLAGLTTEYQRMSATQDRLLTAIVHRAPTATGGGELARYQYTYDIGRQIATWQQTQPGITARQWNIGYDGSHQVSAITEQPLAGSPPTLQQVWRYTYDASGNRIAAQEGNRTQTAAYNRLNQFTSLKAGGSTWFRGKVSEPSQVTLNGVAASVKPDGTFEALLETSPGVQDVVVQAQDKAGNSKTETWRVDNGSVANVQPSYDSDGNLLTDGTHTYTWDAANRMTSVAVGQANWAFAYDGKNRRISETKDGNALRQWVWSGTAIREERQVNGEKHRFWAGGIEILNTSGQQTGKRFVLSDHLGSARLVVDGSSGTCTASYDYSPWGKRNRVQGSEDWGTGYTGHWWHESGLSLAVYRPYDTVLGRWPSRDPIAEDGGWNLYVYNNSDSINKVDPLGLCCDNNTIREGREILSNRYKEAVHEFTKEGIKPKGKGLQSCKNVAGAVLMALGPIPKCWSCKEERGRMDWISGGFDHQWVTCKSLPESGTGEEIAFDFWKGNQEGVNVNFNRYNYPNPLPSDTPFYVPHDTCERSHLPNSWNRFDGIHNISPNR